METAISGVIVGLGVIIYLFKSGNIKCTLKKNTPLTPDPKVQGIPHPGRAPQQPTHEVQFYLIPLPGKYVVPPSTAITTTHTNSLGVQLEVAPALVVDMFPDATYTNGLGIQPEVAPAVVVDMSPDATLPVYALNPTLQDIQFSSHPRPTFVTTVAEADPVTKALDA
ncbi:MAG: hypothetical protein J3R72DRAFT_449527 [Linnemannia gamsii]|nr:MAG: hypothetical protein J3R72DRAFT_449527 [Linnemannia gamsii]